MAKAKYGTNKADTFPGTVGQDIYYGLGGGDDIDGRAKNDRLYGGDGNDKINGGGGTDRIFGDAGEDRLLGGLGDDYCYGGAGNDVVNGAKNDDKIYGGLGVDKLIGGSGGDHFYFKGNETGDFTNDEADTITDFNGAEGDRIRLRDVSGFDGNDSTPSEGHYGIWNSGSLGWVVTYREDGKYHDIAVGPQDPTGYVFSY